MIATFFQDDLAGELEKIFSGFRLKGQGGSMSKVSIIQQNLPVRKASERTEKEPFPYIIVRVMGGELESPTAPQLVTVYLLFGVFEDEHGKSGHKDVLNMIQKICERFGRNANLTTESNNYLLGYPVEWELQDEESHPHYFGGMKLKFETPSYGREDIYS